jgi:hypothetical protein
MPHFDNINNFTKKSILQKNYSSQGEEKESCNRDEPLIRPSIFIKLHLIIRFKLRKKGIYCNKLSNNGLRQQRLD